MNYEHHSSDRDARGRAPWWSPGSAPSHDTERIRVSNDERQEAIDALIAHWSAGRLDEPTFDQRAARARAAVTRADLRGLFFDLPPQHPTSAPPMPIRLDRPRRHLGWLPLTILVLLALWATSGIAGAFLHPHVPWLLVGLIAWIAIASHRLHRPRS